MGDQFWIKNDKCERPTAVISVGGRMGLSAAQQLMRCCSELLEAGFLHLIINMADVNFIASSGAGSLVVISEESEAKGGSFQIVSASDAVIRVIDLLNLYKLIRFTKDERTATINLQVGNTTGSKSKS